MSFSLAFAWLADLIAPRICMACARPNARELCSECRPALPPVPARGEISGVLVSCATRYEAPIDTTIHRLKYENRPDLARPLGRLMCERLGLSRMGRDTWLVPVPLHAERLAERGYNQAALLCRTLGALTELRCAPRALVRVRHTDSQARLGREARAENVRDAFRSRERLSGRSVMLVDDVITTGATAKGAIAALRAGGADVVAVLAIARAGST